MNVKRFLAVLVCVVIVCGILPVVTLAEDEEYSVETMSTNLKICGVDIGIAANTRMNFNSSKTSTTYVNNGYYYNGVYLAASQCFGFARWCQYKIYGAISAGNVDSKYTSGSKNDFYKVTVNGSSSVAAGSLTTTNLKNFITAAKPGAHLRTNSNGSSGNHSMVITEITDKGFSIAQANGSNNDEYSGYKENYVGTHTYTWSSYVSSTYGQRGIAYIEVAYKAVSVPDAPTISKTEQISDTSLKVSWSKVSDATSYEVWHRRGDKDDYEKVGTTTSTSYTDTGLSSGSRYWYRVYAVNSAGNKSAHSIDVDDNHGAFTKISRPSNSADNDNLNYVNLSWKKSYGANTYTYTVYRADPSNGSYGSFKVLKSGLSSTSYTDTTAKAGTVYKYYIATVLNSTCTKSDPFYAGSKVDDKPTLVATSPTSIKISWNNPTYGSGVSFDYVVKRKIGTSDWVDVTTTSSTSYEDKNLTTGQEYRYYIQFRDKSGNFLTSNFSALMKMEYLPTGVTLNTSNISLTVGDTSTLTATVTPSNATDKTITWSSSNTSVASVSNGKVTAVAAGTATITAKTSNGKTATCTVTVVPKTVDVTGVTLNKASATLTVGDTSTLTATVAPSNATDKTITWSSSNTAVASVSNGKVTAVAAGTSIITAKTTNGKTATCTVTVVPKTVDVTGVSLDKTDVTLTEGESATLTATVAPSNATNKNVTWNSSDTAVATVDNGVVKAVKAGSAAITVTTSDGNKTASCTVTVNPKSTNPDVKYTADVIVGKVTGRPGDTVNIPISISNNPGIAGFSLKINYDKTLLSPVSIVKSSDMPGNLTSNIDQGGDLSSFDYVTAYWVNPADYTGNGEILNVTFKIAGNAPTGETPVTITYESGSVSNQDYDDVGLNITNGSVEVSSVLVGDVLGDGIVNTKDGVRLSQYLAEWEVNLTDAELAAADIVRDGKINTKDGVKLSQYLAEWDVELTSINEVALMSAGNLSFEVGSVAAVPGETVDIPIIITENTGVAGFNLKLDYDNTKLLPVSIAQGSALNVGSITSNIQQGGDLSRFDYVTAYWVNPANVAGTGVAFTVRFKVLEEAEGEIPLNLRYDENDAPCDQNFNELNVSITSGAITVGGYETVPEPEPDNPTTDPELKDYTVNSLTVETVGASARVRTNVTKNSDRVGEDAIVIAMYKDGALVDILFMEAEFATGQTASFGGMMSAVEGATIKAFVWDSLENMQALSNFEEFSLK